MYDLNKILDDVREKYYCSKMLPRPTISWSDEYWTEIFGQYNLFNNHITISRVLNNVKVSYDELASVVYHESIHQDFGEHDRKFALRANKFPNYKKCYEGLSLFMEEFVSTFDSNDIVNNFEKNKQSVCYILLPNSTEIIESFKFYNNNIYLNNKIKKCEDICNKSDSYLFIFLLENGDNYHVVGWSNDAKLLPNNKTILHSRFGGLDVDYQLYGNRKDMYILFNSTCWYTINKKSFPSELRKDRYLIEDILNKEVQEDISFINTYCEGYNGIGIDDNVIDIAAPICNLTYKELLNVAKNECGFRGIWIANALCNMKENFETVFNRADVKRDSCLIDLAYKDMKQALEYSPNDQGCIIELIKLCAMVDDFKLGSILVGKLIDKGSINKDKYLKESINYIKNQFN